MLYGGSLPEHRVISDERYRPWFTKTVYLPELTADVLADLDGLYIPEGTNHRRLQAASAIVQGFLARGGTVLLFGDQPVSWLPGIAWEFRPALAAPKLVAGGPDLGYNAALPPLDQIWHHHGVLRPPAGASTLLSTEDGAGVLYVDRVSTPGTILATTLDPLRHTGETAAPQPSRYLERFLPWVVDELMEQTSRSAPLRRGEGSTEKPASGLRLREGATG